MVLAPYPNNGPASLAPFSTEPGQSAARKLAARAGPQPSACPVGVADSESDGSAEPARTPPE